MSDIISTLGLVFHFFRIFVAAIVIGVIVLMLLRMLINYANFNPFSKPVITLRRLSDPFVEPIRNGLVHAGVDTRFAPLLAILITILIGYFGVKFVENLLFTIGGVVTSLQSGAFVSLIGYLLYGLLAIYALMIFARIIFSYGVSYANPVMRFLVRATEPVLAPARRLIPPIGMFDISPMIVLFLLSIFQTAIAATMFF